MAPSSHSQELPGNPGRFKWNRCHDDGGCTKALRAQPHLTADDTPATGLTYVDTTEYLTWINRRSGHDFRLPTVEEWSVMAAPVLPDEPDPIFTDPNLRWASAYLLEAEVSRVLRPRGAWATTAEGVADLNGSVWEWTQDCYSGSVDMTDKCPAFYVGGEHIAAIPFLVGDPARGGCATGTPPAHLGMRLVSDRPVPEA